MLFPTDIQSLDDPSQAPGGVLVFDSAASAAPPGATTEPFVRNRRPRTAEEVDLDAFAAMVLGLADNVEAETAASGVARGRFGPHKVFIAAIRRELRHTKYRDLPKPAVDELLLRAHRASLVVLSRADLVAAMDPDELRDSEIIADKSIGVTYHFVFTDGPRNAESAMTIRAPVRWNWIDAFRELRHHAESMRGFFELNAHAGDAERWPRTTGADVVAIAALLDPHVRAVAATEALGLHRRWTECLAAIGRGAIPELAETYVDNRALWRCLAAVFVHLASVDAPPPDPATWDILVAELGRVLALRNAHIGDDGHVLRGAGPAGDAPFKPSFAARTFHELFLEQYKYLIASRGSDVVKPEPGVLGGEKRIPRTTNGDVVLLCDYWSKQLAKVHEVRGHESAVARWKAALDDVDHIARTGDPNAVYSKNNLYWRELSNVARQVAVADEAPTKWDMLYESLRENLAKLPARIGEGAKAVSTAASDIAGAIAHGVGKVANEAGKGLFSGFGTPLLVGAGLLGVFLISRARRGEEKAS